MSLEKRLASVSLDLDNQWSYMKIHGDTGWEDYPSYFDIFIPHVLDVLDTLDIKITVFIVGQDAALEKNHHALRMVVDRGHEVGNHSFYHESWLHLFPRDKIESEIVEAETKIEEVTGQAPLGFRGPGFSWSPDLLDILASRGYIYDASTLPTIIGPFARMYYFWTSHLTKEEKKERKGLFGSFKDGLRSIKPYSWELENGDTILEIPVSTIPVLKVPFHLSYLLYISTYSMALMKCYLAMAIRMLKTTKTDPSFLLHPLDLIGGDQVPDLAFFPGMNVSSEKKVGVFTTVLRELSKHFKLVTMNEHARALLKSSTIKSKKVLN